MKLDIFSRTEDQRCNPNHLESSEPECARDTHPINPAQSDNVSLSSPEQQTQQDNAVLEETSDTRARRVAELRQQVRSGNYEIPIPQLVRILAAFILRRR